MHSARPARDGHHFWRARIYNEDLNISHGRVAVVRWHAIVARIAFLASPVARDQCPNMAEGEEAGNAALVR
jgi:hypothetical protein